MSYPKTKLMNLEDGQTLLAAMDGEITEKMAELKTEIEESKADIINITDSTSASVKMLTDGADGVPMGIQFAVEPVQDTHGYDNPWPAGGGKNLLPMILDKIKTANTNGTWNGNVYTLNNVAFTVQTDSNDNVLGINVNGTASADTRFNLAQAGVDYGVSGDFIYSSDVNIPQNVYVSLSKQGASNIDITNGNKTKTFTADSTISNARIFINSGVSLTNLLIKPMIRLSTVTDDSFAPYSNICPISGWAEAKVTRNGKNLIPYPYVTTTTTKNTLVMTDNGDGTITANGTPSANTFFDLFTAAQYFTLKAGTYKIPATGNANIQFQFYKTNGTAISNGSTERTFTLTEDTDAYCFLRFASGQQFSSVTVKPMLLIASETDTEWETYNGTIHTITFPDSAGTVYGGTLTVNKDGTGSLVVDEGVVHLKDLTWEKRNYWCTNGTNFHTVGSDDLFVGWEDGGYETAISDVFKKSYERDPTALLTADNNSFWWNVDENRNFYSYYVIWGKAGSESTLSEFTTFLTQNDPVFCGKLYSPVTIPLTATQVKSLLGVNNIYADTGNILSVDYSADTKLYVDGQIADKISASQRLMELIVTANREDGMKATKAYSAGELLIVSGTLYKATTSVANGATLTVGTNITATTVAAEIAALA